LISKSNTYGHILLDFCRKNNIYIVNGRVGKDKLIGECTCQDVSMIEYFLSSSKLFLSITEFMSLSLRSSPCSCLIKIVSTVSIIFCNLSSDTKFCKYSCDFSLHLQDDVDLINYMYDYENIVIAGASLSRNSNCTGRPNTYGHMLLDFCRKK
jgi:hypothetical protein